ncbi:MAG TPA: von Willebrand factor type A domain-containing protein, partial [Verrucomicrobiae bacterium]
AVVAATPAPSAAPSLAGETPAVSDALLTGGLRNQASGTSSAGKKTPVPGAVAATDSWDTDGEPTLSKGLIKSGSGTLVTQNAWGSFDGTAQAPVVTSGGTLALNGTLSGNNTYNGGTVVNGGTITFQDNISDGIIASASSAANPEGTFPGSAITGLTKDDVGGLRYLVNNGSGQVAQSQESEANFGFADTMHQKQGNVALADGSAQQFTTARFRSALTNSLSGTTANRLAFQTADAGAPKNLGEEYRKVVSVTNSFNFATVKNLPALQLAQNKLTVVTPVQQQMQQTKETDADVPVKKPAQPAPIPQPEIQTRENNFSTFSLNVSDVSFKLAAASLEKGQLPEAASIRSEEFINAFDYRDPEAAAGVPVAFASERARYPFAHNRELLRFSVKTAAQGRQAGRPLNLVLLLDNSGSMERADRVAIIREALRVLAAQLQPQDKISVITFARTARLWVDGVSGDKAGEALDAVSGITPEGGTNLEEAMNLAYQTALRHYLANGANRVVLLTDGAANLGNVDPDALKQKVEAQRKQGIALDCFGIGWEGFNDDLLEVLARNGDGRYGFINTPEEAATGFAGQLAGALKVAASDVKVQVEFNPKRVTSYRQIGYAKHQLTKEQFRDNTVDAAEIAAQEAGNALYTIETNPGGEGPIATVRVRYKIPGTTDYREQAWDVPYAGNAIALEQSSSAMRLAATASAFSEWLASSPFAAEVTPDQLLNYLSGVPEIYGADQRPKKLEWMIRQAKSVAGK